MIIYNTDFKNVWEYPYSILPTEKKNLSRIAEKLANPPLEIVIPFGSSVTISTTTDQWCHFSTEATQGINVVTYKIALSSEEIRAFSSQCSNSDCPMNIELSKQGQNESYPLVLDLSFSDKGYQKFLEILKILAGS